MTDEADLEVILLRAVMDAHLPPEEPISRWIADPDGYEDTLKLRAHDLALILGACEYHVDRSTGWVEVRDYSDHPTRCGRRCTSPTGPASRTCLRRGRT